MATVTSVSYTGDNSTTDFTFSFPYLINSEIVVSIDEVETSAWSLLNSSTIRFDSAPATDAAIRIYRDTDITGPLYTFNNGSVIDGTEVDRALLQVIYSAQEIEDEMGRIETKLDNNVVASGNLPNVSLADNDKILQVVGGVWTTITPDAASLGVVKEDLAITAAWLGLAGVVGLSVGTAEGDLVVLNAQGEIDTARLDTGSTDGQLVVVGAGDKIDTNILNTGTTNGQLVEVGAGNVIDQSVLGDRKVTAFGIVSSAGTLQTSVGISSCVRNSEGEYRVTLSTAQSSSTYLVLTTPRTMLDRSTGFQSVSTTQFDVVTYNASSGAAQDSGFTFAVLGN